jgi:hypothetical protein
LFNAGKNESSTALIPCPGDGAPQWRRPVASH